MRVPLRRHIQSRGLSCRGIRLPDRSNAPVVGRHRTAGQERLFAATIGTTGFHRTGRREKQQTTATWIAGPPVLLVGKMNARRVPAERPKGLAYPLTCLPRWSEGPWAVHESRRDSVPEDSRVPRLPALVAGRVVRGN